MTHWSIYIEASDFDRLIAALTARTDEKIARAVVVKEDSPLFYFGPIGLDCDGDEGFKALTTAPAGEVLPAAFDSWRIVMIPRHRWIELYVNGYNKVSVYDTLKGGEQ
ncbi:MAG: hypothetical protein IKQ60_06260 [Candidatus Methanomethylophilaceae archaeon]|nr:hypothetical protein [Candidatus Methanomethylophilaceae archaeon]